MDSMYYEFAKGIKNKLYEDVNGRIKFEIYDHIDTVVFKIFFKDFEFSYAVNDVQDMIYSGSVDGLPDIIKKEYMKEIKRAFFKSESHKRRDELSRMGIHED